jgi:hypothetical protein
MCNYLEGTNFRRDTYNSEFWLKSATDQKRWQINKNDLCRFDSQFSVESKNEIKLGWFHLKKKHNFSVFIILGHAVYIPQYFPNMQ